MHIIGNTNSFIKQTILRWVNGDIIDPYQIIKEKFPHFESWEPNHYFTRNINYIIINWDNRKSYKLYLE